MARGVLCRRRLRDQSCSKLDDGGEELWRSVCSDGRVAGDENGDGDGEKKEGRERKGGRDKIGWKGTDLCNLVATRRPETWRE